MGNSPIVSRINGLLAEKGIAKRNFYQNCYKPAARFFEPVQQFSCSPGFSFHSRFVFRGSVVSLRSFGLFGSLLHPFLRDLIREHWLTL